MPEEAAARFTRASALSVTGCARLSTLPIDAPPCRRHLAWVEGGTGSNAASVVAWDCARDAAMLTRIARGTERGRRILLSGPVDGSDEIGPAPSHRSQYSGSGLRRS